MLQAPTKDVIAAIKKAGWTPNQFADAIKVSVEDATAFLDGGFVNHDAADRFERFAFHRIGISNGSAGIFFDRPQESRSMGTIMAPPVVVPDEMIAMSEIDTTLTDVTDPRARKRFLAAGAAR